MSFLFLRLLGHVIGTIFGLRVPNHQESKRPSACVVVASRHSFGICRWQMMASLVVSLVHPVEWFDHFLVRFFSFSSVLVLFFQILLNLRLLAPRRDR